MQPCRTCAHAPCGSASPRTSTATLIFTFTCRKALSPKTGPSAGITMATAISSALSKIPVRRDIAMTGEITLRGKVLPIGGLKEKLLAALRAGIKEAIIPKENEKDLADVPENIRGQMKVHFVENMDQVLKIALETPLPDFPEEGAQTIPAPAVQPEISRERYL